MIHPKIKINLKGPDATTEQQTDVVDGGPKIKFDTHPDCDYLAKTLYRLKQTQGTDGS